MEQEYRMIDTGLRGPIQKDILASVMGQLSDGRWQNSPRMEQYWRNADVVEQGGKVYLQIRPHSFPYYAMSDAEILQWFGKKIKILIKEEFGKSREVWNRTNTKQKTDYLSHKYPSQTTVADCYYAYDTLMGRKTSNKVYGTNNNFETAFESLMTDVDKSKKVVTEGIMERLQNKFREIFENWTPQNGKNLDREDGINDYGEPYYCWEQEVWVALNDEGKIYVEANGQGFVSEFELDEARVAKQCIDQCLYDLGYGDVNFESVKPSKKKVVTEGAMKEIYTKFVEAFAYWVPSNQTSRGDLTEDMEGNPCVAFEDGRVVISLLEFGRKIKVCADQSQDYMRKYFNFDEVGAIKKYTESLIDYIRSDANNLQESKRVNTKRKVIKQSINERKTKQMISQAVDRLDLPRWANKDDIKQDIWDAIINDDFDYAYDSVDDLELIIYDYLKTEGMFNQSAKPSKKRKVIKEDLLMDVDVYNVVTDTIENMDLPNDVDKYELMDTIRDIVIGKDYHSEEELAEVVKDLVTNGINSKHYNNPHWTGESKMSKTVKHLIKEGSFDNDSWDYNAKPQTLDEVIAKLQQAREELGNVEVAVQYRDDGGEYYGYDNSLYYFFDKDTKTFVL